MALYFYILRTPDWVNLAIIAVLGVLTFVPIKFVHPLRVRAFRNVTIPMTVLWAATSLRLVIVASKPGAPEDVSPIGFEATAHWPAGYG